MFRELQLVAGGRRHKTTALTDTFRLRPGERPIWVELEVGDAAARAWRRRAGALGLSVDVWLAVQVEWELVRADLASERVIEVLLARARSRAEAPALAPTDELRAWVRCLVAGPADAAEHDLPSVALPARIAARLRPATLVGDLCGYAESGREQEALVVERAASLTGMTMEAWAYREATRLTG
jgi:hypothetical protein